MSKPIKSYSLQEVKELMEKAGLAKFRAKQVIDWVYAKRALSYDEMTNLPKAMREQLQREYPLFTPRVVVKQESIDGTRKYLLEYHDGTMVETVGLPSRDGRLTACVSSQSGCAMACSFCATGKAGLCRSLDPGEIVDQVFAVQDDFEKKVTNVVVMGQGEPFSNYEATLDALRIMNNPRLLNIGARHITVSTCGIIAGIERFAEEPEQFTLAVSLHAARQQVRDLLMPGVKNQRLGALRQALSHYVDATGRRFTIEYALMKGVNDGSEDLEALTTFCRRLLCHVNIIPLNKVEDSPYQPVSRAVMNEWQAHLEQSGTPATVRLSKGPDISAACGQLRSDILATS